MKLAIITSGFLPVPATKGGAVENLIVNFMNKNEKKNDLDLTIFSVYDKKAKEEIKKYKYTNCVFIKPNAFVKIFDKIIFFFAKNILKKKNSQSYRFIVQRLYFLNKVSKYIKKYEFDKILLENHPTQYLALKWRKNYIKYAGKYYYHCHNELPSTYGCKDIMLKTNKFISVSQYIANYLIDYLKIDNKQSVVVKNGIDEKRFNLSLSDDEKIRLKKKYSINQDEKVLIYTGRIVPEKGIAELLDALKMVKYTNYKLLLVGSALNSIKVKTSFEEEIEDKISKLNGKVVSTGFIPYNEIAKLYKIADLGVFPSIWDDPAPLTIIESLVCGLPIITTQSGGIPEYATNKSSIILKRDENLTKNIADSIDMLLIDDERRKEMSNESKKISKNLTSEVYYENLARTLSSKNYQKNVLFDTSSGTLNMGDYIIVDSVEKELNEITKSNFLAKYPTHTPVTHFYQNLYRNGAIKYFDNANFKFIAGTNLLNYNMLLPWNNWNVNIFNYRPYKNAVLVGVGMNPNAKNVNSYTKLLYKKILSKEYYHSTRDEKTKKFLESLGLKAINTGCATMWSLTSNFCKDIPIQKSEDVIFTLTDYCPDPENDQKLINLLNQKYKKVYFWIQGSNDYEYLQQFDGIENIIIVGSSLREYSEILNKNIDYIGTRLHAGIYAMQHKCRSIILAVDNRALDIKEKYNINCLLRNDVDKLENMIDSDFETNVNINKEAIKTWKNQFKN